MKKLLIVFVLGVFLIPSLSYARVFNGPSSQNPSLSRLKKKAVRSAVQNVNQITDKVEIRAGEMPMITERTVTGVEKIMPMKPKLELEEDVRISDEVYSTNLEEDYSGSSSDSDREIIRKELEITIEEIRKLREREKELRNKLKNLLKAEKKEWIEEKKETKSNWLEEKKELPKKGVVELYKGIEAVADEERIDQAGSLQKTFGTLLTKVSHPTEEGGSLLLKTNEGTLAFQVTGENWSKFEVGDQLKVVYYSTPTARDTFKAQDVSYLENDMDNNEMNFQDDYEEQSDAPEEDVIPLPKPELYYEKPVLEQLPEAESVVPDFSERLRNLFPPASTLQQSMFESSSWQKLRERNIEANRKMSRYNKLRSLGGSR